MNDSLTFDELIESMCNDPEFVAQCEENNRKWDEEAAAEMNVTVEDLHVWLGLGHS